MRTGLIAVLLAFLLTGCAGLRTSLDDRIDGHDTLAFIDRLNRAEAGELTAIGKRLEAEPGKRARLRRALWRGTPGHEGFAPERARADLQALLQGENTLDRDSRLLLQLQLDHLEERARLAGELDELTRQNRELRRQIEELTALERRMGGNGENDE